MLFRSRITAVDQDARNFVDDVGVGDLWYFPAGIPHSIQGLEPDGCEFLLVFDDGSFSEDNTFLISDWFKHVPPRCSRQELRRAGILLCQHARPERALHLASARARAACVRSDSRSIAGAAVVQSSPHGTGPDPDQERNGPHRRFQEFPRVRHDRGRAGAANVHWFGFELPAKVRSTRL